jgi:hypothetical protein
LGGVALHAASKRSLGQLTPANPTASPERVNLADAATLTRLRRFHINLLNSPAWDSGFSVGSDAMIV